MRLHRLAAVLFVAITALANTACDGERLRSEDFAATDLADEPDAIAPDPEPVTLDQLCVIVADVEAEYWSACYRTIDLYDEQRDDRWQWTYRDCLAAQFAFEDGLVEMDAAAAAQCVADLEPHRDGCVDGVHPLDATESCRAIFTGTVPNGDACRSELSLGFNLPLNVCADGWCRLGDTCPGTCTAYLEPGEDCTEYDEARCAPEAICEREPARCVILPGLGEPCSQSGFCQRDLFCVAETNTCVAPAALGEACDDRTPCVNGARWSHYCGDGVCRSRGVEFGEPCAFDFSCADGLFCGAPGANGEFGTCGDGALGDSCLNICADGHRCEEGLCVLGRQVGELCGSDLDCAKSLWCDTVCVPKGAENEPCSSATSSLVGRGCEGDLICMPDGICRPPQELGELCNPRAVSCVDGVFCSTQTERCIAPAATGEHCHAYWRADACAEDGDACRCDGELGSCPSSYWDAPDRWRCLPEQATGDPCTTAEECAPNAYCDGVCKLSFCE